MPESWRKLPKDIEIDCDNKKNNTREEIYTHKANLDPVQEAKVEEKNESIG